MKTFTFVAFAALVVLVHQTSALEVENIEIDSIDGTTGINGRKVRTVTIDENGAQYSRQGRRSNLDATIGADGIQINRNGRNILDGRTANFDVNEDGAKLNLQGRRANLEANAGNRNNVEYSRQVRRGATADGSGVKRAVIDLKTGTVDVVGRRTRITGRIGGNGVEALKIQRVGRDPAVRAQRRQKRQERREERRSRRR